MNLIKNEIAFVFPGQGSQKVGMGHDLYCEHKVAKEVFQLVDDTLQRNLSKIIFQGKSDELTKTYNAQPALMAVSVAVVRVLEYELKKNFYEIASIVSGHSLGEYSALCSIGVLSLEDTSKLLEIRGKSMQNSVKKEETMMTAVLGIEIHLIEEIINKNYHDGICDIANDNCPGQIVLSGHKSKLENISSMLKDLGAKIININVSAPFHSRLMQPAAKIMKNELENVNFHKLKTKYINNVEARFCDNSDKIRKLLVDQITKKVRWSETIKLISSNTRNIVEIGSGKVLTGLNRRMGLDLNTFNIGSMPEVDDFLNKFCK
tara:strand:+ start:782 stop:1738 length:957 start_codon:yes stop_codon:yes gene_type:complete